MRNQLLSLFVCVPALVFSQQLVKKTLVKDAAPIHFLCGRATTFSTPMLIVNGYSIDGRHLSKLNAANIISIDIANRKQETIKEYGEKAKDGVIKVTVKDEYFAELVRQGLIKPIL